MALSVCNPISTDAKGRELIQHGTALFPVACYHDDLHQFEVAWHWHEELEVFTAEEGTARVSVNGADHIIRQGEGVFINTGILHGVWQEGDSACRLRSIQRAAELLRSTDWKISDIGTQCGFQEMSYFAKTFREMKGCTPKGYREQK